MNKKSYKIMQQLIQLIVHNKNPKKNQNYHNKNKQKKIINFY